MIGPNYIVIATNLIMTSVYLDLEDVSTSVSDYVFGKIPIKQFDTREASASAAAALKLVLNAKTDWDAIPLQQTRTT